MNRRGALMIAVAMMMPGTAFAQTAVSEVHDAVIFGPNLQPLSKTRYLLIYTTPAPEYIALLFAGGNGFLNIPNNGQIPASGLGLNFLVRSRLDFVKNGVAVAVVDAPNKIPLPPESKRMTAGYAASIAAVITDVRRVGDHRCPPRPRETGGKSLACRYKFRDDFGGKGRSTIPAGQAQKSWIARWDRFDIGANSQAYAGYGVLG